MTPSVAISNAPIALLATSIDDWTTFAHDSARTGFQAQSTGITAANVTTLGLRWHVAFGESVMASPLVAGGLVYIAGQAGTVEALDVRTGGLVWTQHLGAQIAMTPTLADGMLFVGTHVAPAKFVALDAASGAIRWSATVPGLIRAEPVVLGGVVYEGEAGGDPPQCDRGNVRAYDELSGAPRWTWYDDPNSADGGGIWGPLSSDGTTLFVGTGNTCSPNVNAANALVRLSLDGSAMWTHNEASPMSDDDFGGAATVLGSEAIALDKDGILYDFDSASGSPQWTTRIGTLDGYGGIGTPTTDGDTIVVPGGFRSDPTKSAGSPGGSIFGLDRSGNVRWSKQTQNEVPGYLAIESGLAFGTIDGTVAALDLASGATLWSAPLSSAAYASPALVPSGIYVADNAGDVYAFAPSQQSPDLHARSKGAAR